MPRTPSGEAPVHLFGLSDVGIDREQFLRAVRPSFDRLSWDRYDQVKAQLAYLTAVTGSIGEDAKRIDQLGGHERLAEADTLVKSLPPEHKAHVDAMLPFRRRAMRKYRLERVADKQWSAVANADPIFTQPVSDYRQQTRVFDLIEDAVASHPLVLTLLASAAETLRSFKPQAQHLEAVLHQVSVIARSGFNGSPAPEGVHQDGADCIVSALVIERTGVCGGVSKIYAGRNGPTLLEVELQSGQGICQADAGTDLWHEITAIRVDQAEIGHRMTLGIDLHVA